eukprot:6186661-Prymnesium_polylepis.1
MTWPATGRESWDTNGCRSSMASAALDALFAAAGDDEEVLRRAALIIELAELKGATSVEAFGARFFFETQTQPQPHSSAAVDSDRGPPSASDTLADLLARSPRGVHCGPPLGVPP